MSDDEGRKRDDGMARAAANPANNYALICDAARSWLIYDVPPGYMFTSGMLYKEVVTLRHPNLKPKEKRVMGRVMARMESEGLIRKAGMMSTCERSHKGPANEWIRTKIASPLEKLLPRPKAFFSEPRPFRNYRKPPSKKPEEGQDK